MSDNKPLGHNSKKDFLKNPVEHIDITSFDSRKIISSMEKMSFVSTLRIIPRVERVEFSEILGTTLMDQTPLIWLMSSTSSTTGVPLTTSTSMSCWVSWWLSASNQARTQQVSSLRGGQFYLTPLFLFFDRWHNGNPSGSLKSRG